MSGSVSEGDRYAKIEPEILYNSLLNGIENSSAGSSSRWWKKPGWKPPPQMSCAAAPKWPPRMRPHPGRLHRSRPPNKATAGQACSGMMGRLHAGQPGGRVREKPSRGKPLHPPCLTQPRKHLRWKGGGFFEKKLVVDRRHYHPSHRGDCCPGHQITAATWPCCRRPQVRRERDEGRAGKVGQGKVIEVACGRPGQLISLLFSKRKGALSRRMQVLSSLLAKDVL